MTTYRVLIATVFLTSTALAVDPIVWERLDSVINSHTVRLVSEKGETNTFTLACVGQVTNEEAAVAFIGKKLGGRKLQYWPINTAQTNWMSRPMCIFYDFERKRGGSTVSDFPMLNEEMLKRGLGTFADTEVVDDQYGLKDRLRRAAK